MDRPFKTQEEAHEYLRKLPRPPPYEHPTVVKICEVKVGNGVYIGPFTVLGAEGFGFDPKDMTRRWPHLGKVIIKDGVEIGSHCCIDRGLLVDTVIGEYTKINNLTHIAHNAQIGPRNIIGANVAIGGSVETGENCRIWNGAKIRNKKKIGNNSVVAMGAVVIDDVPDNVMVAGNPAKVKKQF